MIFQNEKTRFLAIKTRSVKTPKIDIFPKELTHGFGRKRGIFPTVFFRQFQATKMSFMIFQNEKTPFQAIKTRSPKSPNIDSFPKGLTRGFGPKMAIFATFFLDNLRQENVFYDILERKNAFLGYIFFQAIKARKTSFMIFQNEKTPFEAIKTRSPKSPKIDIFPKGLTRGFNSKMGIFPTFFLCNIGLENVFYDILERKNAFLGYKNKKSKKSKN